MARDTQKSDDLYNYYLQNGFQHSIDEIADSLHISHKTFFNRYESKQASINATMMRWHQEFQERYRKKCLLCNHTVEELLLFIWEFRNSLIHEAPFCQYDIENKFLYSAQAPFLSILDNIIKKGIRCYHFYENSNIEAYSKFLLFNLSHYPFYNDAKEQNIRYLLSPLLNERGKTLLEEMDLLFFL